MSAANVASRFLSALSKRLPRLYQSPIESIAGANEPNGYPSLAGCVVSVDAN